MSINEHISNVNNQGGSMSTKGKSRKIFTFEYINGEPRVRVRVPETAEKYDPTSHFLWFEESDYLSKALKGVHYSTFLTDDREEMENMMQNGYLDAHSVAWIPFFAYWKDQKGRAFMVPENSGIEDLRDIGVHTFMKSPADFMKVGKYVNRLLAALPKNASSSDASYGIWGNEIPDSWDADEKMCLILVDSSVPHLKESDTGYLDEEARTLSVKYVDLKTLSTEAKALVDGCIVVSDKAVRVLQLSNEPRLGMAWRGTFGTPRGLGKGHMLYKNDMDVDVVIYGPKEIVKTDRFFFGSMGELHAGTPHTDRQAVINFHFHQDNLLVDLAKTYMRSIIAASKDEPSLRRLLLRYTSDLKHSDMGQDEWILRKALAYGVSFLRFPALFRRVVRYLMTKVLQADQRARIPMDTIANYGYVLPDPNVIDSEGNVHPERGVPEGTIIFPDVAPGTRVVCYRQPSENTNAWVSLKVISRPEYKPFAGRGICLLGQGAAEVLGRLGGGDMDDQFVIVHDPKWVEHFHNMPKYPETEKLSAELSQEEEDQYNQEQSELNAFTEELLSDIQDRNLRHYTIRHVSWQIELSKNARAGIGPVVNYGMMDMLLSDEAHKASMLEYLQKHHPEQAEWLANREPYQAALLMTNLEIVIDSSVKDPTLRRKLGDVSGIISGFHKECQVYPSSMVPSRIPLSKLEANDFVSAPSLTCKALETIKQLRDRLADIFVEREWSLVTPGDKDLRVAYPFESEIGALVRGRWKRIDGEWTRIDNEGDSLMDKWAQFWRGFMSSESAGSETSQRNAYKRVTQLLREETQAYDDDYMRRLAVEIYFQTYRTYQSAPRVDDKGRTRNYNDGLLWNPVFANHFIDALRYAKLSGYYVAADIFPWFRRRLMSITTVITLRNRVVFIQGPDDAFTISVGMVMKGKAPDGKYRMDGGLIEIRRPQAVCLPEDEQLIIAQRPMTRLFPPKEKEPEPEVIPAPEPEPKTVLGRMLQKAMNVLKGGN